MVCTIFVIGYFLLAFGQDAKQEGAVATLESRIFTDIPSQCWHFVFSLNVSNYTKVNESRHLYPSYYVQLEMFYFPAIKYSI